jgi:hypothetical protein
MHRAVALAWGLCLLAPGPLAAQQSLPREAACSGPPSGETCPLPCSVSPSPVEVSTPEEVGLDPELPWRTVWGLGALRVIPEGPRMAPNGQKYHPNFSMDLNINCWLWPRQRLYLFGDLRFWGQRGEQGVTNGRDGALGTSKREFDISGGAAWNYAGPWELRAFGYSGNNLNRGDSLVTPAGFTDGFGVENRYYLSEEYTRLGQTGFDVARAPFVSFGYYPSKEMRGNDGRLFKPGLLLRAYLIYDLGDWPVYAFGDVTFISESSFEPRLLLFDLGFAARPFRACHQLEFRLGAETTADFQGGTTNSLWYAAVRYIF